VAFPLDKFKDHAAIRKSVMAYSDDKNSAVT